MVWGGKRKHWNIVDGKTSMQPSATVIMMLDHLDFGISLGLSSYIHFLTPVKEAKAMSIHWPASTWHYVLLATLDHGNDSGVSSPLIGNPMITSTVPNTKEKNGDWTQKEKGLFTQHVHLK